jgi:hypothetical protein
MDASARDDRTFERDLTALIDYTEREGYGCVMVTLQAVLLAVAADREDDLLEAVQAFLADMAAPPADAPPNTTH